MAEKAEKIPLEQEIRDDNKQVAGWLLYYHERKKDYERRRQEILHSSSASAYSEAPGQPYISDTTGRKGTKLAELERTERWLELVEEVERRLPWKMQIFLLLRREYRYARGRQGWTAAVQWRFAQEVADRLGKKPEDTWVESRKTFTRWWDRIIDYAARLAAKKKLL